MKKPQPPFSHGAGGRSASVRSVLPPSERDNFVLRISTCANGQLVPACDCLFALLTALDIEHLAHHTGEPEWRLSQERPLARRRLLEARRNTGLAP
jgi:hypothetical protein